MPRTVVKLTAKGLRTARIVWRQLKDNRAVRLDYDRLHEEHDEHLSRMAISFRLTNLVEKGVIRREGRYYRKEIKFVSLHDLVYDLDKESV